MTLGTFMRQCCITHCFLFYYFVMDKRGKSPFQTFGITRHVQMSHINPEYQSGRGLIDYGRWYMETVDCSCLIDPFTLFVSVVVGQLPNVTMPAPEWPDCPSPCWPTPTNWLVHSIISNMSTFIVDKKTCIIYYYIIYYRLYIIYYILYIIWYIYILFQLNMTHIISMQHV